MLLRVGPSPLLDDCLAHQCEHRGHDDSDGSQDGVGIHHQHQSPHDGQGTGQDLDQGGAEHFADGVHIVGEAAHDITGGVGVKIPDGQSLQLLIQVIPQAAQRTLGHGEHQPLLQPLAHHRGGVKCSHDCQPHRQARQAAGEIAVGSVKVNEPVDDRPQQVG